MLDRLESHDPGRFGGELDQLHQDLITMATRVLTQIQLALQTFRQPELKTSTLRRQQADQVDRLKHRINHAVTAILFQDKPFTDNLHAVTAFSKMLTDVERLADEAARIVLLSDKIHCLPCDAPSKQMLRNVSNMGTHACDLLQNTIEILATLDKVAAEKLLTHSNLDKAFCSSFRVLTSYALEDTRNMRYILNMIMLLKSLETTGHHVHNLAEDMIDFASSKHGHLC